MTAPKETDDPNELMGASWDEVVRAGRRLVTLSKSEEKDPNARAKWVNCPWCVTRRFDEEWDFWMHIDALDTPGKFPKYADTHPSKKDVQRWRLKWKPTG